MVCKTKSRISAPELFTAIDEELALLDGIWETSLVNYYHEWHLQIRHPRIKHSQMLDPPLPKGILRRVTPDALPPAGDILTAFLDNDDRRRDYIKLHSALATFVTQVLQPKIKVRLASNGRADFLDKQNCDAKSADWILILFTAQLATGDGFDSHTICRLTSLLEADALERITCCLSSPL